MMVQPQALEGLGRTVKAPKFITCVLHADVASLSDHALSVQDCWQGLWPDRGADT